MLIEHLYFRPDGQTGPDFAPNHLKQLKSSNPEALEQLFQTRELVCQTLGIPDLRAASDFLRSTEVRSEKWQTMNNNLCVAMCQSHGVELPVDQAVEMVEKSMQTVLAALDRFTNQKTGLLSEQASVIGQMSGPQEHHEPLTLLQMIIDPDKYTRVVRFEAARKWELAQQALFINLNESKHSDSLAYLTDVFNENVWNGGKIGTTEAVECVSRHDRNSFKCVEVQILEGQDKVILDEYSFYHTLRMRRTPQGTLAMWEHRIKPPGDQLIKLLRRQKEDPTYKLSNMLDSIGMRLVFLNKPDILAFEDFFRQTLRSKGHSLVEIENEREDTLENGHGVSRPEMIKIAYKLDGIPFEVQLQTLRTYFDYFAADGISHAEYNFYRAINVSLSLFPHSIYGINAAEVMSNMLEMQRERKPNLWRELPPQHSALKSEQRPYGKRRQQLGAETIVRQIEEADWCPDWIIAEKSAAALAGMISEKLQCSVLLVDFHDESSAHTLTKLQKIIPDQKALLLVTVSHTGKTLDEARQYFTGAKTAALVRQGGQEVDFVVDEMPDDGTWYHFS